jgi:hypothetical protein
VSKINTNFVNQQLRMTEEKKQAQDASKKDERQKLASPVPDDVLTYEQLVKKEPNDILALWTETFPLDEEVKGEEVNAAAFDDSTILRKVS